MKRILILTGLFLLPLSPFAADKQVVEIDIEGMSCKFCALSVKRNLSTLPGVDKAAVSFKDRKAHIKMAPGKKADVAQINKKVNEAGFKPVNVTVSKDD